jgi:hypothetical protein
MKPVGSAAGATASRDAKKQRRAVKRDELMVGLGDWFLPPPRRKQKKKLRLAGCGRYAAAAKGKIKNETDSRCDKCTRTINL